MSISPWIILAVEFAVRLAMCVNVIMRRRPVPVTLSWLLFLLTVPIVGTVIYPLLGDHRLGSWRLKRYHQVTDEIEKKMVGMWRARFSEFNAAEQTEAHLAILATRAGGIPPLKGNELELIADTPAFLERLKEDIDSAKHHCHLLYYIWSVDKKAQVVGEALIRAALRGVQCRVLVDSVGSRTFLRGPMCERMRAAGVQIVEALPARIWRVVLARVDLRNHRKIAIIDGKVALTGSHNMTGANYPSGIFGSGGVWIDTSLRVVGPAVQALQAVFLRDWMLDSDEAMPPLETFLPPVLEVPEKGCVVHVIPSGPGPEPDAIHEALLVALFGAREEIIMTTPYFVPDEATKSALIIAARRGVRVTIVVPKKPDAPVVGAAARSHFEDLMVAGVRIYQHDKGLLHAKTISIDRKLGVITSVNFDMRSFWLNFEVSLFVYDDDFASVIRFLQTGYMEDAREIDPVAWAKRPSYHRLIDNTVQLLGPLL